MWTRHSQNANRGPSRAIIGHRTETVRYSQRCRPTTDKARPTLLTRSGRGQPPHSIGKGNHRFRNGDTERPRGREVDREFEMSRELDWRIGRSGAFENLVGITHCAPKQGLHFGFVGEQTHPDATVTLA